MTRWLLVGLIAMAGTTAAAVAPREVATSAAMQDGVHVRVTTLRDRAVFCIDADEGHKVAAGYGVELRVDGRDVRLWDETLPKLISKEENYFDLPLEIDLKRRAEVAGHFVHVHLGACYNKKYCNVYEFDLKMPEYSASAGPVEGCTVRH